jgi:hypothetical protein
MKRDLSLKMPEPLAAVARHPVAGTLGGLAVALIFGAIGAMVSSSAVAVLMTVFGFMIGAPGASYVAQSIARE